MTTQRLNPQTLSPELYNAVIQVDTHIRNSSLDSRLMELVKIRASQINGCAFCLKMHSKATRQGGEDQSRLDVLAGWREAGGFTPAERAALQWTESVTHIDRDDASDKQFSSLKQYFNDKEIVELTILIGLINLFNRLAIAMRYTT